jgi:hypothetical protein
MENLGVFYDHLVYFTAIGNILWPFGIFCGHLVYFPCFGILYQEKSGNPDPTEVQESRVRFYTNCSLYFLKLFFCPGDNILARFDNIAHVPQVQHQLLPSLEQACRRVCAAPGRSGFCMIRKQEVPETS